jgi:radical SAM superfamily enzyme YgiQ (UPF0313 family)
VRIVLLSTYDLGRQPFGLASPAAWLRNRGHHVTCADLSVGPLPSLEVQEASLVAVHLPMHTATRMAAAVLRRVRSLNSQAHLCCYGLYAPLNETYLRDFGVQSIIGGEFEFELAALAERLARHPAESASFQSTISLDRLPFVPPDRTGLPVLQRYPKLMCNGINGPRRIVGYTEASRGCKHLCRHCPIVPVYSGVFRVISVDVVMEDIRRQVEAGAEHITFGDPDFFNGPTHARRIVEKLHQEFPQLSYDVTIKIEHLLDHRQYLPMLKQTGCLFITSAVESIDDAVLEKLDKGHTRADFDEAVRITRENGLVLAPTFIPFTPWTTREGYGELLGMLADLDLVDALAPVQLGLRLLIPFGSRLLELADIQAVIGEYDKVSLAYPWRHPDPEVDALASRVMKIVREDTRDRQTRRATFQRIWEHVHSRPGPFGEVLLPRTVIPYLEEPWFC